MGGALSLLMSTKLDVKGIVAMSAPYRMPEEHPAWQIQLFSYFKTYMPKNKGEPGTGWFDKEAFKGHISYPLNPIRSAAELEVLLVKMRAALPKVNVPVCMIHSKDDDYVLPENMENIYDGLVNASDKTKFYVTGSGHVVTRDAARRQVFEIAREFIKRVEGV
jgi:carboxylesterase